MKMYLSYTPFSGEFLKKLFIIVSLFTMPLLYGQSPPDKLQQVERLTHQGQLHKDHDLLIRLEAREGIHEVELLKGLLIQNHLLCE